MKLPTLYTEDQTLSLIQTKWSAILNPIIAMSTNNSLILENITLAVGANVINHKLGRLMQGWSIVDINGVATVYRSAPFNNLTLTLTSSAIVIIKLEVF